MAYDAIYRTDHTAQISIKSSFKSAQSIKSATRHNNRIGKEGSGVHIDKKREFLNKDLLDGQSQDDIYLNLINKISGHQYTKNNVPEYGKDEIYYEDGKKLKASVDRANPKYDRVLAFEVEAMYPGDMIWSKFDENGNVVPLPKDSEIDITEIAPRGQIVKDPSGTPILDKNGNKMTGKGYFLMPLDKKEFDEWCKATVDFAKERFGKENVVSAQLHMDEQTPHIHIMCTPLVKDRNGIERLNYRDMLGKDSVFGKIQDEYSNAVAYIGYHRGEKNSKYINQISTKEYKVRLSKEMSKEMPKTLDEAKTEIRDLRVRNFDLEERMNSIKVSASRFQKMRNKMDRIEKENELLKKQNQEQTKVIEQQRERIMLEDNRRACIEEGIRIHSSRDIANAFRMWEEEFLTKGFEHKRSLGYTNEQLRYWEDRNHDGINDRSETIDLDRDGLRDFN